jgi:hypothetical protein
MYSVRWLLGDAGPHQRLSAELSIRGHEADHGAHLSRQHGRLIRNRCEADGVCDISVLLADNTYCTLAAPVFDVMQLVVIFAAQDRCVGGVSTRGTCAVLNQPTSGTTRSEHQVESRVLVILIMTIVVIGERRRFMVPIPRFYGHGCGGTYRLQ